MRLTALLLALLSPAAWAAEESAMNAADVSWMMVATPLVLFMTIPGIALFMPVWSVRKTFYPS